MATLQAMHPGRRRARLPSAPGEDAENVRFLHRLNGALRSIHERTELPAAQEELQGWARAYEKQSP